MVFRHLIVQFFHIKVICLYQAREKLIIPGHLFVWAPIFVAGGRLGLFLQIFSQVIQAMACFPRKLLST